MQILGPKHPDVLRSMTNMALALHQSGQFLKAAALHREVLDLMHQVCKGGNIINIITRSSSPGTRCEAASAQ